MITTLVFDVNETMLDLAALDKQFERILGDPSLRRDWFALVLRNALTLNILGRYHDFATVAGTSLEMVATARGIEITAEDRASVSAAMINLPPHPDVPASLERLGKAGFELVALTNSPPEVATAQLSNSGLKPSFDHILSVDAAQRLKPDPEVYRRAAAAIEVPLERMMMVAAHDWDIAGAMAVGMAGGYVTRPGMAVNPLFAEPTLVAPTMDAMADEIIEHCSRVRWPLLVTSVTP